MSRFLEALHSGRVLLMDGAMGTELIRAGLPLGEPCESWNLTHPERVRAVHRTHVDAGAEVLLTNTFQANWVALASHGLTNSMSAIQKAAYASAQSVRSNNCFVLYDVGAFDRLEFPAAHWTPSIIDELFSGLGSADGVLLETFSDASAPALVKYMRGSSGAAASRPILLSLAYQQGAGTPRTRDGKSPEDWADLAMNTGVSALGVNCGRDIGMDEVIDIIRRYRQVTDLPLFARPNAGTPTRDGDRWVYPLTPAEMARRLPELLEAGVSMVGGCCGTTPEHIAAMRPVVEEWNNRARNAP